MCQLVQTGEPRTSTRRQAFSMARRSMACLKDRSMRPLTLDDLVPLAEYVGRRAEFFDAHLRYCDRYRRVRIGPSATLVFENRQTLWFRLQEVVRVARLTEPGLLELE